MGGCVSVEGLYTKMLAKSSGSFKIHKTEVVILNEFLPKSGVETITIPLFEHLPLSIPLVETNLAVSMVVPPIAGAQVGSNASAGQTGQAATLPLVQSEPQQTLQQVPLATDELQQSQNLGPNKVPHRIHYNRLCSAEQLKEFQGKIEQGLTDSVLFQLREKRISQAECDGVGFNIKHLLFVMVDKSPNFLKDKLPSILQTLYARAELMHYPSLGVPPLHNSSMLGCGDAEVAQAIAATTVAYLSKPPAIDAKTLSRIYFVSADEAYTSELKKAFQSQVDILKSRVGSQEHSQ